MEIDGLQQTSAPAAEPVSLASFKAFARVDNDSDDVLIEDELIPAARQTIEELLQIQLITATWALYLPGFPSGSIVVPRPPLSSVTSIQYVDVDGDTQTLDTDVYDVFTNRTPGRIAEAFSEVWPATRSQQEAVTVTYQAGFGTSGSSVPTTILQAIRFLCTQWYDQRAELGQLTGDLRKTLSAMLRPWDHGWRWS